MRFGKFVVALGMASMLVAGSVFAADRGTPDEAKVLVEKAAAHFKAVGAEKAFADFNDQKGGSSRPRPLRLRLQPRRQVVPAARCPGCSAAAPWRSRTSTARNSARRSWPAAMAGGGFTEYRMSNPATKKAEPKKTYALKVGDYVSHPGPTTLKGLDPAIGRAEAQRASAALPK